MRTKTTLGDRAFCAASPKLWNSLPDSFKKLTSVDYFKAQRRNYYWTALARQLPILHNRELKHEDFSGDAAVMWAVETGTRSIAHDIPRTADVVLPATTRVEWIWRRSESREWFKRMLTFLSFVLLPVLVDRFQSMLHLFFLNSLSLIALTDQAEMTTEPCRHKCNETRWA